MPLILHRDDEDQCLVARECFRMIQLLVKAFSADIMAAHEVSRRVNSAKHDAPECSARLED